MKKKISLVILLVLVIGMCSVYAGNDKYDTTVFAFNANRELATHEKSTGNDLFKHRLDYMYGNDSGAVYAWMETPLGTNLSNPETKFTEKNSLKTVNFYSGKNLAAGAKVTLNIENAVTRSVSVAVRGYWDYQ